MTNKWTGKIKPSAKDNAFLYALLPEWFADAVRDDMSREQILQKLSDFFITAEELVALKEQRPVNTSPPDPEYVEAMYRMYMDILKEARGSENGN